MSLNTDTRCERCRMPMLVVDHPRRGRWAGCPRCGHTRSIVPRWYHGSHRDACRREPGAAFPAP